jgi:hypothetical protein
MQQRFRFPQPCQLRDGTALQLFFQVPPPTHTHTHRSVYTHAYVCTLTLACTHTKSFLKLALESISYSHLNLKIWQLTCSKNMVYDVEKHTQYKAIPRYNAIRLVLIRYAAATAFQVSRYSTLPARCNVSCFHCLLPFNVPRFKWPVSLTSPDLNARIRAARAYFY